MNLLQLFLSFIISTSLAINTKRVKVLYYKKPYITSDIKNLIRDKRNLYKKFRKHPITFEDQYKSLKTILIEKLSVPKKTIPLKN